MPWNALSPFLTHFNLLRRCASAERIELPTPGLGNLCSILLSYAESADTR